MGKATSSLTIAAATSIAIGMPSVSFAQDVFINDDNIAQCSGSGNGRASRGELATPLANAFWSRMACGIRDEAFELLDAAPKAPIDMLPNPYPVQETWLSKCYFNSFAYGRDQHDVTVSNHYEGANLTQEFSVSHGFFGFQLEAFQAIQGAMLHACTPNLS